jgi:uncharacterized glyoxalase superfamily protein PhnB
MPDGYPTLCPYLYYADVSAAMEFLEKAFGFKEKMLQQDQDGTIRHAEMQFGDAVVMMGAPPGYKNPNQLGHVTVGMYVHVDDVQAHYERAKAAGANVEGAPMDQTYGVRSYGALDPEGHQWWFAQALG